VGSGPTAAVEPEPVVSIRARVVDIRKVLPGESVSYDATFRPDQPRTVATLPIGYADGLRRALSNRGSAILKGKRVPIAGIVTMDMTMIDVTDVPCEIGDVVTLAGVDGLEEITIVEMAAFGELSPYEVLTGLRQRLTRIYIDAPQRSNEVAPESAVRSPQSR
jgi:alanine racemase